MGIIRKCKRGHEIAVYESNSGYYIGTWTMKDGPNCRLSGYYPKRDLANKDLEAGVGMVNRSENISVCPDCTGYGNDIWKI
jgi:hypothetical protein